jgi:hypothetical protein
VISIQYFRKFGSVKYNPRTHERVWYVTRSCYPYNIVVCRGILCWTALVGTHIGAGIFELNLISDLSTDALLSQYGRRPIFIISFFAYMVSFPTERAFI